MQMPYAQRNPQAAPQICSQVSEARGALQQHMSSVLGLRDILHLTGTCRTWHQLIEDFPVHQLSQEARRAVLPPGLKSGLPLLQLVKQQAQLLERLRGKHGFTPGIQHLGFQANLADGSQQGHAQQTGSMPLQFREILWSPCTSLEVASRWLALKPNLGGGMPIQAPIVMDLETGQQVCFSESPLAVQPVPRNVCTVYSDWLTDKSDQILSRPKRSSVVCLADVHGHSILPLPLSGAPHEGASHFHTIRSEKGFVNDILCWICAAHYCAPGECLKDQISMLNASNGQPLYHLSCPQQLHQCFLQLQIERGWDQQATSGQLHEVSEIKVWDALLAPMEDRLAVVWRHVQEDPGNPAEDIEDVGLSIHSAITGDVWHSRVLARRIGRFGYNHRPSWLPCSSNLMFVSNDGLLQVVTSSGCNSWSHARVDRNPLLSQASTGH